MIEALDGARGDYHPTRLGDKLNEVIKWIDAHEKLTLNRFETELLELLTKPESKVYQQLKEMFRKEVWYKEQNNDK